MICPFCQRDIKDRIVGTNHACKQWEKEITRVIEVSKIEESTDSFANTDLTPLGRAIVLLRRWQNDYDEALFARRAFRISGALLDDTQRLLAEWPENEWPTP